jgi:hypothetical protein
MPLWLNNIKETQNKITGYVINGDWYAKIYLKEKRIDACAEYTENYTNKKTTIIVNSFEYKTIRSKEVPDGYFRNSDYNEAIAWAETGGELPKKLKVYEHPTDYEDDIPF